MIKLLCEDDKKELEAKIESNVKTVNGVVPDENGNVEIKVGSDSGQNVEQFDALFEPIYGESVDTDDGNEPTEIDSAIITNLSKETDDNGLGYIKKGRSTKYACLVFNTDENTDYRVSVSGTYNRFRVYGTTDYHTPGSVRASETNTEYYVDEIYKDDDTISEYEFNSNSYRTIFVYLTSNIAASGISATVYELSSVSNDEPTDTPDANPVEREVVGYKAKLPIDMTLSATSVTAGVYKWLDFYPWIVSEAPCSVEVGGYGYNDFIDNVYEPLRAEYPSYITRSVIGRDASDTYDIYQYTFCPDYPEQTIYLQSGVHGNEPDGWIGLANVIRAICNDWGKHPGLAYLRWACRICVVPVVNPYGMQNGQRLNANSVDLNRDTVARAQSETVAACNYFEEINAVYGVNVALDCHTTESADWGGDCAIGIHDDSKNIEVVKRVGIMLARKNSHDRLESYLTTNNLGKEDLYLPYFCKNETDGTFEDLFYANGVPGATVEWSDFVYDTAKKTEVTMKKAAEMFGNYIIQHASAKFGILC